MEEELKRKDAQINGLMKQMEQQNSDSESGRIIQQLKDKIASQQEELE